MQNMLYTRPFITEAKFVDANDRDRTITARITTDRVDSDKEVVLTDGLDMGRFDKNPVVLFMHMLDCVIGKCIEWRRKKKEIIAVTEFAETATAQEFFLLCSGGFLRGWSVGMEHNSIKRRDIMAQDIRKCKDWAGARWVIEKAVVGEYSLVSLPANEDALTQANEKGLVKLTRKWLMPNVAPPVRVVTAPAAIQTAARSVKSMTVGRPPVTAATIANEVRRQVRYLRGID